MINVEGLVVASLSINEDFDASLISLEPIAAELTDISRLTAEVSTDGMILSASFDTSIGQSVYQDYTGDYEVNSFTAEPLLTTSLVLPTFDKHMTDNVTVYSVPTTEENNEAGGVTFTIGG